MVLPAASLNELAGIMNVKARAEEVNVGVKVAVYVVPEPVNPVRVPPMAITSLEVKSVTDSEIVKVTV